MLRLSLFEPCAHMCTNNTCLHSSLHAQVCPSVSVLGWGMPCSSRIYNSMFWGSPISTLESGAYTVCMVWRPFRVLFKGQGAALFCCGVARCVVPVPTPLCVVWLLWGGPHLPPCWGQCMGVYFVRRRVNITRRKTHGGFTAWVGFLGGSSNIWGVNIHEGDYQRLLGLCVCV